MDNLELSFVFNHYILRSTTDSDVFQSRHYEEHSGQPKTLVMANYFLDWDTTV